MIDESYRHTDRLRDRIATHEALELASEPETSLLCFRAAPAWCPPDERDDLNGQLQKLLLREYDVVVTLPTYRGDRWLRAGLSTRYTDEATIDRLVDGTTVRFEAARER